MYAVEGRDFSDMTVEQVKSEIDKYDCRKVCITGGEPLLQEKELELLAADLIESGNSLVLETSGHKMPPSVFWKNESVISMDCKCPSSAMHERMDFGLFEKLRPTDQLKFVILDADDFEYAVRVLDDNDIAANVIFQPAYGTDLGLIAGMVIDAGLGRVRVLPQLHKIIWGQKRGV